MIRLRKVVVFHLYLLLLIGGSTCLEMSAQETKSFTLNDENRLAQDLLNIKTKSEKFNLFLNLQGGFSGTFDDSHKQGRFFMRDCRIEAKGILTPWLAYRYRQKLNVSSNASDQIDHLPQSLDYAYLDLKLSDRFSLILGKHYSAYGGIEFDLNPIEVYHYSDFISNSLGFVSGATLVYAINDKQTLNFQVSNNRTYKTVKQEYGVDISDAYIPLSYTLNWNGHIGDFLKPRWSFSYMNLAKSKHMYFVSLGNDFNFGKFGGYFDFMYSSEDLDQKRMMSSIINKDNTGEYLNLPSLYMASILELNYKFTPNWNVFVKGTYETVSLRNSYQSESISYEKGKYRDTFNYSCGVEFFPSSESNLHFFITYFGKYYSYTDKAKALNWSNTDQHKVALGFVYQLPMF